MAVRVEEIRRAAARLFDAWAAASESRLRAQLREDDEEASDQRSCIAERQLDVRYGPEAEVRPSLLTHGFR
jgi:hypothetical protein